MKKVIKGGNIVFYDRIEKGDILIDGEKIEGVFLDNEKNEAAYEQDVEIIHAEGMYVMPGTIDPHMHLGLYKPLGDSFRYDTGRQAVGGVTTLINYHRGKGDYFETVGKDIEEGEKNSLIDFAISLGLCAKRHVEEIEEYVNRLGITSFKFFFDKQDIAHEFYGIPKDEALVLDKADLYYILKKLASISPRLLLCVHCEDPDLFRAFERELKNDEALDKYSLSSFGKTRPPFVETTCAVDSMWINSQVGGNMYIVHTAAGSTVDMYEAVKDKLGGRVTFETCPHYLILDENSPCRLLGKVNPPLHTANDSERLWKGIADGVISTMGTDNVPVDMAKKFEKGDDIFSVFVGFGGAGMILPVLITEGYLKRGIPLTTLSRVNSTNTARIFGLEYKGEIIPGYDADLVVVDVNEEKTITPELYGWSDFSVYSGMKLKGWPRYTISRGEVIQKDGVVTGEYGRGKYIRRNAK